MLYMFGNYLFILADIDLLYKQFTVYFSFFDLYIK